MMQILIPMAGSGRPFELQGQVFPKPLVEIADRSLVEFAIAGVRLAEPHRYVFVIGEIERASFALDKVLSLAAPGCGIYTSRGKTGGALCSAMLAIDLIDPAQPLLVCNGDQFLPAGLVDQTLADFRARDLDVGILTFDSIHPRWSFALVDEADQLVYQTAEKRPISRQATVGIYYYREASMFFDAGENAILKNNTFNDQFYICPSINELILKGYRVGAYDIGKENFFPMGTPQDVERFRSHPNLNQFTKELI